MKNKYIVIFLVIVALIIAAYVGSYVFVLGAFLFKMMLGIVAIALLGIGILIGRFFPYSKKEESK